MRPENSALKAFILDNVETHPAGISSMASAYFGVSRTTINSYLNKLIREGLLVATGTTSDRRYSLRNVATHTKKILIEAGVSEDVLWRTEVRPILEGIPENILAMCAYGFTEIFNNVIDHSESREAYISIQRNAVSVEMTVVDQGIGIFEKIQQHFHLPDPRTALLELSKGKLTSDSSRHSGEGIFFSSRMFDVFSILSGKLFYRRVRTDDWGWLIETEDEIEHFQGTRVTMRIGLHADWTARDVFNKYTNDDEGFTKTHVPISLGKYPGEMLVSRSQAKRILARVENFAEVMLDFQEVDEIGQAFADEIFRVYKNSHPHVTIKAIRTTPQVDKVINHVLKTAEAFSDETEKAKQMDFEV